MDKRQWHFRVTALLLCCVCLYSLMTPCGDAALINRKFALEQAQRMAVSNSSDITKQNNKIVLKRMKYVEAVEGIKAKIKNLTTFRWIPLLSFQFPQQLTMTQEYELKVKPLLLQTEIDNLVHQLKDLEYKAIHEANQRYFEVYYLQEKITFTQARLEDAQQQLNRNTAKLAAGDATQADVDRAQSNVNTLTKDLSSQMREFQNAKTKLSETTGVDVSVGYTFLNPFKTASIPRKDLDSLIQYTLDHDHTFFEVKAAAATALLNVNSYESFMRGKYGGKMNGIQSYINIAKQGMDVDYADFQLKYREMLGTLDQPWNGSIKILFFRFPKEWFKGAVDGTRYIEDELYAIYTACMEYGDAMKERDTMEKELRTQVQDTYESLITNWNTYTSLQELVDASEDTLERVLTLNRLGKATYEEVADEQTAYQDAQLDALSSLKDYNVMLSEFDRLTCGAVTKYLKNTGMGLDVGEGGDAYAVLDPINEPYYYIYSSVADLTFYIGVSIPENFQPVIDSFEIWYNGTQIGQRTDVGSELRHLTLDYQDEKTLVIRLYNGDTYVDECEINAGIPRDVLDIEKLESTTESSRVVGTYEVSTSMQGGVSVSEMKLRVQAMEGVSTYTLHYGQQDIYTTKPRSVDETFSYLTLMITSLQDITATLYDSGGEKLMDVRFDTKTQELVTLPDEI